MKLSPNSPGQHKVPYNFPSTVCYTRGLVKFVGNEWEIDRHIEKGTGIQTDKDNEIDRKQTKGETRQIDSEKSAVLERQIYAQVKYMERYCSLTVEKKGNR